MDTGSCSKTSNNKFFGCPPRMDDARHFTDYRPNCHLNNTLKANNKTFNSFQYRMFLTHNANKHYRNIRNHPKAEKELWTPNLQENKTSQYGGCNIRYKRQYKKEFIEAFKEDHDKIIPWNKIRYIF